MRNIWIVLAALLLVAGMAGCACSGTVGTASPSPTGKVTGSPTAGGMQSPSSSPDMLSPEASTSPDANASSSPDANASSSPDANASSSPDANASIPNFTEGKEVDVKDVPKVKEAVEQQAAGAEILSVKHAKKDSQQVYAVTIKLSGKEQTLYVLPDGSLMSDAATTPKSGS